MKIPNRYTTRPARLQQELSEKIRRQIITGELPPGARMPTQRALEQIHQASRFTVQAVLEQLKQDGFICPQGRRGTFVADPLPHHRRIGLVFPWRKAATPNWSHFHTAIYTTAQSYTDEQDRCFELFFGGDSAGMSDYEHLYHDVEAHRIGGVVFMPTHDKFLQTPVATTPSLARVAIGVGPARCTVRFGYESFFPRAIDDLIARGRRRISFLALNGPHERMHRIIGQAMAERGLTFRRHWVQSLGNADPHWIENCLLLLLSCRQDERPDALVIMDDNQVTPATQALANLGIRVPEDVEVIAHTNFPCATPSSVPVTRLGFDMHMLLRMCLDLIERQHEGLTDEVIEFIPAVFAHEVIAPLTDQQREVCT